MLRNRLCQSKTSIFAVLLLISICSSGASGEGVVTKASIYPDFSYTDLIGSVRGGTMIYIKGGPFNVQDKKRNEVFVGLYSCVLDHYYTAVDRLACKIPEAEYPVDTYHDLTIRVNGVVYPIKSGDNKMRFYYDYTPRMYIVAPQSAVAGETLKIWGWQRFTDYKEIQSIKVGGKNCAFTDDQLEQESLNFWGTRFVNCKIPEDMDPGQHDVTMISSYKAGQADFKISAQGYKVGNEEESYMVKIHPRIDSLSSSSGYQNGNRLEVKGQGFGTVSSDLTLKIGNLPCKIVSATDSNITCDLDALGSIPSAKIHGGNAGLKQQIFDINIGIDSLYTKYKDVPETIEWAHTAALPSGVNKIDLATILSMENYLERDYYVQRMSGIFTAPASGVHTFYMASDDDSRLYMSKLKINFDTDFNESDMVELVCVCPHAIHFRNYFYLQEEGKLICKRTFNKGDQYYMIHIQREGAGGDEFSLAIEVPNTDSTKPNLLPQVQKVYIDNTPVREEIEVWIRKAEGGTFKMVFPEKVEVKQADGTTKTETNYSKTTVPMDYNISASSFRQKIYDKTHWWYLSVVKTNYLANGTTETSVEEDAVHVKYHLKFDRWRGNSANEAPFVASDGLTGKEMTVEVKIKKKASDPITGTFKLKYGDETSIALSYNTWYFTMSYYLERLTPLRKGVTVNYSGVSSDGHTWYISLDSVKGTGQTFEVVENALKGGPSGSPQVKVDPNFRPASNNLFYRPVPPEFLTTFHKTPQLVLSRKGMDAACPKQNCDYTFIPNSLSLSLKAVDLTGNVLTMTLADAWSSHADKAHFDVQSNFTITYGNSNCLITLFSLPTIKCEVAKDGSNKVLIEAGDFKPRVLLKDRGYLVSDPAAESYTPTVSLVSPSSGSEGGGTEITIEGQYFSTDKSKISVTLGSGACVISSASHTEIKCKTPKKPSGSTALKIALNSKEWVESSAQFTYSAGLTPTISSLSLSSASPVVKQDLVISGLNFGTDRSKIKVLIRPKTPSASLYDVECFTNDTVVTDTSITCRLSGGRSGDYYVQVEREGHGLAKESSVGVADFKYIIEYSSISPTTGSTEGGTILTITGKNFSTKSITDNQVIIGDNKDLCIVQEIPTSTQIICKTLKLKESTEGNLKVYVTSKIIEEAHCVGTCYFKFLSSKTPKVTSITQGETKTSGSLVTLVGENFSGTKSKNKIKLGEHEVTVKTATSTQITFDMPSMSGTSHALSLSVEGKGTGIVKIEDALIMIENKFQVDSIDVTTGSVGGNKLTISGNAFNPQGKIEIKVGSQTCHPQSVTPTTIVCWFYHVTGGTGATEIVKVTNIDKNAEGAEVRVEKICDACKYTALSPSSPSIKKLVSVDSTDLSSVKMVVEGPDIMQHKATAVPFLVHEDQLKYPEIIFQGTVGVTTEDTMELVFTNLASGVYDVMLFIPTVGFTHRSSSAKDISVASGTFTSDPSNTVSSFYGGASVKLKGSGLLTKNSLKHYEVRVCGRVCDITDLKFDEITCTTPILNNETSNAQLGIEKEGQLKVFKLLSEDDRDVPSEIIDGDIGTRYHGSSSCQLVFDFGSDLMARVTEIKMFPGLATSETDLANAKIQGSNTGNRGSDADWETLVTIPDSVVEDWNHYKAPENSPWKYRAYRLINTRYCRVAEMQLLGVMLNTESIPTLTDHKCDVKLYRDGVHFTTVSNGVSYSTNDTPILEGISPEIGTTAGGTEITIKGQKLDKDGSVKIDGISCPIDKAKSSDTALVCTTGARPTYTPPLVEHFKVNGGKAVNKSAKYLYADRWSQTATWGGESLPRKGDLVHVPVGQTLLVDVAVVPTLASIVVEGTLIFSDEMDMTFDSYFIMVKGGRLEIGTPESRYTKKLTITLHGERTSTHFPGFGNKNIMVQGGSIDIHGEKRTPTWTMLQDPVEVGVDTIKLIKEVDWRAGEKIIIAPTGKDRDEYEEMTIKTNSKSGGKSTLELTEKLKFKHYAGEFQLGGKNFEIRGEVGLLTRNVVVQGDANSERDQYGSHIMMRGEEGKIMGRFSYMETRFAGQAFQMGRYPIHYHMIGNVSGSYIEGCSVHHTFNRATTIHGVHQLQIKNNVYFKHLGHAIFVEDSAETKNIVDGNLVIHISVSTSLLKSDLKPAGIWITHPDNVITNNHIVGSSHFSFWYDLPNNSTGPSASATVCPIGHPLGKFENNVGHGSGIGLRIYPVFKPRTDPCGILRDFTLTDPWEINEPVPAKFRNNLMYHNGQGIFHRDIGAIQHDNLNLIGNGMGLVIAQPDNARDTDARIENSFVIGSNPASTFHGSGWSFNAMHTSRKDGFLLKDSKIINYVGTDPVFRTCTGCHSESHRDLGGRRTTFEGLTFENVSPLSIHYRDAEKDKDIFYDRDGSFISKLTGASSTGGWITPWQDHYPTSVCKKYSGDGCVPDCAICQGDIELLRVQLKVPETQSMFTSQSIKVINKTQFSDFEPLKETKDHKFGVHTWRNVKMAENFEGFTFNVVTNSSYNVHVGTGIDFKRAELGNNRYWKDSTKKVKLYFNNTEARELYKLERFEATTVAVKGAQSPALGENQYLKKAVEKSISLDGSGSSKIFGDYAYDAEKKELIVQMDGKRVGYTSMEGIFCEKTCDNSSPTGEIESRIRRWSVAKDWEWTEKAEDGTETVKEGKVPGANEDVEIRETWNMYVDVPTQIVKYLRVKGRLSLSPDFDEAVLNAKLIDIDVGGEVRVGTSARVYTGKKATITLHGDQTQTSVQVGAGITPMQKAIIVRGKLNLFGLRPQPSWTLLKASAAKGATSITIEIPNGVTLNWKKDDQVVISSSSTDKAQAEVRTITSVSSTGVITLDKALDHFHYGAASAKTTSKGTLLDMRAEVGLLNRNVVVSATTEGELGCSILVPRYDDVNKTPPLTIQGAINADAVQFDKCGQKDTDKAAVSIRETTKDRGEQLITYSSFTNGQGWALNLVNSEKVTFNKNVIWNARRFGIYLKGASDCVIDDNLLVKVRDRGLTVDHESYDVIIGVYYNDTAPLETRNVVMRNNRVSSVEWFGYMVPGYSCSIGDETKPNFSDNVGHSSMAGWFPNKLDNGINCQKFSHFTAFKNSEQGFVNRQDGKKIRVLKMVLADNANSIAVNGGSREDGKDYLVSIEDSVIYGQALPSCVECYQGENNCGHHGVSTSIFNNDPFVFNFELTRMPLHNSTSSEFNILAQNDFKDLHFENFKSDIECATKGKMIRLNNFYQDGTVSVFSSGLRTTNVDEKSKFFFANHTRHANPVAFCGKRDCTGIYNTPIFDRDGSLFQNPMTAFGFNKGAGRDGDCTFNEVWNGHLCNPKFGQLNIHIPKRDRDPIAAPVTIKRIDHPEGTDEKLTFEHKIDSHYKLTALVKLKQHHLVEYSATMPPGIKYRLLSANESDYMIIKVHSENPAPLILKVTSGIKPKNDVVKENEKISFENKISCGYNYYIQKESVMYFVLTANKNCEIEINNSSAIAMNARMDISVSDFYQNNGVANFIDQVAASLGISTDRVRVVNVYTGSTVVNFLITREKSIFDEGETKEQAQAELQSLKDKFVEKVEKNEVNLGAPVLEVKGELAIDNSPDPVKEPTPTPTPTPSPVDPPVDDDEARKRRNRNIGLGVGIPLGLLVIAGISYLVYWRTKKKMGKKGTTSKISISQSKNITKDDSRGVDYNANAYRPNTFKVQNIEQKPIPVQQIKKE